MLDRIPPEVLQNVAFHYIVSSPSLSSPLPLLLLNKRIYESLNPSSNPNVYAKVFRAKFDTSASERRDYGDPNALDDEDEEDDEEENEHGVRRLAARRLRDELIHRVRVLARVRDMVHREDVSGISEEDLWVLYLMLTENDGKNIRHLIGPNSLQLEVFLRLCHEQHLLEGESSMRSRESITGDSYPAETASRALMVWIFWLTAGYFQSFSRPSAAISRESQAFVLRPYVFAAHKYETCFAPWTIPILPAPSSPISTHERAGNPFAARLSQQSRATTVQCYGRRLTLSPPMLSHAAMLLFFSKSFGSFRIPPPSSPEAFFSLAFTNELGSILQQNTPGQWPNETSEDTVMDDDMDSSVPPTSQARNLLSHSRGHDLDFDRLRLCYDSTACPGLARRKLRNTFGGAWEGTFSFFDFDAYALMLSGQRRALYEGPYGEQAQVWKLTETWLRPKRAQPAVESAIAAPVPVAVEQSGSPEIDTADWAGSVDIESSPKAKKRKAKGKGKEAKGLPVHGPMMNAGLPTNLPSTTGKGLASAVAEAATLESTIQQQVEALPEYERVPDDEVDALLADPKTQDELEMLLTGTGHSAWGRFILKGRIRAWDGLAILVKEYAPDSRGKWFYRGYVTSTDTLVGRWRDTYTAESLVGYEGTFILNRR